MNRSDRIHLVLGFLLAIVGLVLAFVGAPVVAVLTVSSLAGFTGSPDEINEFMSASHRMVRCYQWMFFGGLSITGISLLYCFALWAKWFIGPRGQGSQRTA